MLDVAGQPRLEVPIRDISRGGAALPGAWGAAAGTELSVTLPGVAALVPTRVDRTLSIG